MYTSRIGANGQLARPISGSSACLPGQFGTLFLQIGHCITWLLGGLTCAMRPPRRRPGQTFPAARAAVYAIGA